MTSQGSASGRFTRAIKQRNLFAAEMAMREMGNLSLLYALDYLELLAELRSEKLPLAAVRFHGRLEVEAPTLTLSESQLALAALGSLCAGVRDAIEIRAGCSAEYGPHAPSSDQLTRNERGHALPSVGPWSPDRS